MLRKQQYKRTYTYKADNNFKKQQSYRKTVGNYRKHFSNYKATLTKILQMTIPQFPSQMGTMYAMGINFNGMFIKSNMNHIYVIMIPISCLPKYKNETL